jgi:hypothetical protein
MTAANRGVRVPIRSGASHEARVQPSHTLQEYRVGRLSLSLPATARRAWQEHRLLSAVHFREVEWTSSNGYKEAWNGWFQKLAERRLPQGARESIVEQRELTPRCQGVLAQDSEEDANLKTWFALLDAGTHGVWLECTQDPQDPEQALSRLETVARSYHPLSPGAHRPTTGWFYLERGALTLPPVGDEQVLVQFEDVPLDLRLELSCRPAIEDDPDGGLMIRLQRALALGLQGEREVTLLRTGARKVAGFDGEELIIQVEEAGNERLTWGWWCAGRAGDPCAPCIELTMHSTGREREAKLRLWEEALESMRYLLPVSHVDLLELL